MLRHGHSVLSTGPRSVATASFNGTIQSDEQCDHADTQRAVRIRAIHSGPLSDYCRRATHEGYEQRGDS